MATIREAYNNWMELYKTIDVLAIDAMQDSSDEAESLNREQLYEFGIKSTGELLPPYSPFTVAYKRRKGQIYDHMTLKDTGAFHKSFKIKTDKDSIELFATDNKTEDLMKRYGRDIFGLTEGSKDIYFSKVRPVFFKKIRKILNYGR